MANGQSVRVRSHRFGGPPRRRPWRVIVVVAVVLAGSLTVGIALAVNGGCSGRDHAVVAASPDIAPLLSQLNDAWAATKPAAQGVCVSVTIEARDSALMATELGSPWDATDNGPAPDVWIPASSVWERDASNSAVVARMLPTQAPSLARSPSVIAMPRDLAAALGSTAFDWSTIAAAQADPTWWTRRGQAVGGFSFAMTDPRTSTAGLLALMSVADANNDGTVDPGERTDVVKLKQATSRYLTDTSDVVSQVARADATSKAAVLAYGSGFPALERDVIAYNATKPKEPLVAIYPKSGSFDADYPYLALANAPWSTKDARAAAAAFRTYASSAPGRSLFLAHGYRDGQRGGGPVITAANGVAPTLAHPTRAVPAPSSVAAALTTWTAITRTTNLLLVLDISGSMKDIVTGTKTRMDLAKAAAVAAVQEFDDTSSVGLWVFSSGLDGSRDYKPLVPLGTLSDSMSDGHTRRQDMTDAVRAIVPTGDTGLYDTVAAAQAEVMAHYQQFATNLVVLLTDGKNDDPTGGLDLAQLRQRLVSVRGGPTNVPVVTIGFGADADFATLATISHDSGTVTLSSQDGVDIDKVLLAGIFGAPSGGA
jgi:Ca-activated chloride channel homolog